MKYTIQHKTAYTYLEPVSLCHNIARLVPRNTSEQICKNTNIQIEPKPDRINDYKVTAGPEGLATTGIRVHQPYGDHRQVPVDAEYRYRALRPTTAYFDKHVRITDPANAHRGSDNDHFCTFLTAQPVDELNCVIRLGIAINFGADLTEADILKRQDAVFEQDRLIVETQHPERIPLDLKEELHVRSDRLAVAYRRWLKELGVTYGTFGD